MHYEKITTEILEKLKAIVGPKDVVTDADAFEARLADALRRGVEPSSAEANDLAEQHRASIEKFYDCGYEMQVCLGDMYVADPRFAANYAIVDGDITGAEFVRDALRVYANAKL